MYYKNEKGSSLLLVLLVSLIFMALGLSIISASIGGAKRTEISKENAETTYKAIRALEEVVTEFQLQVNDPSFKLDEDRLRNDQYQSELESFIDYLKSSYSGLSIIDISNSDYGVNLSTQFTRVYELSFTATGDDGRNRSISRKLFLSPTPSFLQFAAGSGPEGTVSLNGAVQIIGNLFTKKLITRDIAYFTDEKAVSLGIQQRQAPTLYPAIIGDLYIIDELNGSKNLNDPILKNYFDNSAIPNIKRNDREFIDVNFKKTFAQKINDLQGVSFKTTEDDFDSELEVSSVIRNILSPCTSIIYLHSDSNPFNQLTNCSSPLYLIEKDWNYLDISNTISAKRKVIVYTDIVTDNFGVPVQPLTFRNSNDPEYAPLYVKNDLLLNDDTWLVVHGDLEIISKSNSSINISGNILVTGDLKIHGDEIDVNGFTEIQEDDEVKFDSTIFTLGTTEVYNTNISGLNDKQLVLLSKEDMIITRINEFKTINDSIKPLEAYFYTDSDATLYGVGSLFYIKGGLFARNDLTINSIRQNVISKGSNLLLQISSPSVQEGQNSRFNIQYDKTVITDQLDALPRVDKLQVILDDIKIN